ncbi:DUF5631 domain-containing protein [Mycobacterium sp. M26]|uniref:DUF5631 domain-containing protein n=1 Tax=Mycobacterium sp. M26 TaxID=1762962 RepID=UPI00073F53B4|nr:DUF5631 domain-containing protein [Mycobacterium sp. M26]
MAKFGRNSARQRLRRATRQALSVPTFDNPTDCTPWVIGGLWPAELETVTPQTAMVAEYLKNDLQRIATSANERLRALQFAGYPEDARRAEEARIINVARAFAVLRVESTVRQLRNESLGFAAEYASLTVAPEPAPPRPTFDATELIDFSDEAVAVEDGEPVVIEPERVEPEPVVHDEPPEPPPVPEVEDDESRLARLLEFVARQEPGLRWAVGDRTDGTTVVVTDLAHGWIPSGVDLPAGVDLLAPARRGGRVAELLGDVVRSAIYHPGDPFSYVRDRSTASAPDARRLSEVDDLGWKLGEATHWRDGLPRIVHTLAKAGAARTGVVDAEVDVLRVHSDTARYQLLAQYPDIDAALLSNCLLLAATEAIAVGDEVSANYHFAWFEALNAPPTSQWSDQT